MTENLIEVTDVSKIYHRGKMDIPVLEGLSLSIEKGDFLALMGPSGSGKTTLLNLIGGLDSPSGGTITIGDVHIEQLTQSQLAKWRSRNVGFVFQFYNLIPSLTARENVIAVTEIARDPMAPEEALDMVGLASRLDHFPAQLSGGEQQRVAIARAISKRPRVLLCDEPTGALDSATGILVLAALERANRETGTTTIIITHNASIANMADRVITLSDGVISGEHRNSERQDPNTLSW